MAALDVDFGAYSLSNGSNGSSISSSMNSAGLYLSRSSGGSVQTGSAAIVTGIPGNHPRIGNGGYGQGLLLEEQRKNNVDYSRDSANTTFWVGGSGTETSNYATSVDGRALAERSVVNSGQWSNYQEISPALAAGNYVASQWQRATSGTKASGLTIYRYSDSTALCHTGDVSTTFTFAEVSFTQASGRIDIYPVEQSTPGVHETNTDIIHDLHQVESGSFPTSYIDVTGSVAATRSRDILTATPSTVVTGSRTRIEFQWIPIGSSSQHYNPTFINIQGTTSATDSYVYLNNTTQKINVVVSGTTAVTGSTTLSWTRYDTVKLWAEFGNGGTVVIGQVNSGALLTLLSSSAIQAPISTLGGVADIFGVRSNTNNNVVNGWLTKIKAYDTGYPTWVSASGGEPISGSAEMAVAPIAVSATSILSLTGSATIAIAPIELSASSTQLIYGGVFTPKISPNNLLLSSVSLEGNWSIGNISESDPSYIGQVITGPDGTNTSAKISFPAVSTAGHASVFYQGIGAATAEPYTISVWLRGESGGEETNIMFVKSGGSVFTSARVVLATEWRRYTATIAAADTGAWFFQIGTDLRDTAQTATSAITIHAAYAQLEQSSLPYPGDGFSIPEMELTGSGIVANNAGPVSFATAPIAFSAEGTLIHSGSSNIAIAPIAFSAEGTLIHSGSSNIAIAPLALSASGDVVETGIVNLAIAPIAFSAEGTLIHSGSSSIDISAIAINSTGELIQSGSTNIALSPIVVSASGALIHESTATIAISTITFSGSGDTVEVGAANIGISPIAFAATGIELFTGEATQALAPMAVSALGETSNIIGTAELAISAISADTHGFAVHPSDFGVVGGTTTVEIIRGGGGGGFAPYEPQRKKKKKDDDDDDDEKKKVVVEGYSVKQIPKNEIVVIVSDYSVRRMKTN